MDKRESHPVQRFDSVSFAVRKSCSLKVEPTHLIRFYLGV